MQSEMEALEMLIGLGSLSLSVRNSDRELGNVFSKIILTITVRRLSLKF